jgi:hypothetical protein
MNQPIWPSMDGWIKKMWHIYTMHFNSAIKDKTMLFAHIFSHIHDLTTTKKAMKVEVGVFEKRKGASGRGKGQERVIGGEYDQNTLYTCTKR